MSLRWLFIDIGGPILDDGPLFDYLAAALRGILTAQGRHITGQMFQEALERGWSQGAPSTLDYLIHFFVSDEEQYRQAKNAYWEVFRGLTWDEYRRLQVLRPDVPRALEVLSSRYGLATLSNNVIRVKELLEELDVARFFSVWGISEEVGHAKPDPQLFWHVLRQAGCRPPEAMMVGDRLDNDILPAQKLGLATAQVMLGHNFGAPPAHARDVQPDLRVSSLWELAEKLIPDISMMIRNKASGIQRSAS